MSSNSQYLKAFNDHFFEFIDDILTVFPNDNDLEAAKLAFLNFRKMNPKLIVTMFKTYVVDKYRNEIEKGDLNFFIDKNYSDDVSENKNNKMILSKIDMLRDPIRQMGKENQDKALKYINNLCKLADLYN